MDKEEKKGTHFLSKFQNKKITKLITKKKVMLEFLTCTVLPFGIPLILELPENMISRKGVKRDLFLVFELCLAAIQKNM